MESIDKTCLEIFQQRHTIDVLFKLHESESMGFNQLQKSLGINTLTLQRRLEDLQRKKFIVKSNDKSDSRSYRYTLSKRGIDASAKLLDFRKFLTKTVPKK